MRLRLNGNCRAPEIREALKKEGHEVSAAAEPEHLPPGIERDLEIQREAQDGGWILVTGNIRDWCTAEMNAVRTGGCILVRETRRPSGMSVNKYKLSQIRKQIEEKRQALEEGAMTGISRNALTGEDSVREVGRGRSVRGWSDLERRNQEEDDMRRGMRGDRTGGAGRKAAGERKGRKGDPGRSNDSG